MSRKGLSPGDALRRTQKEKAKKKNKETRLEQRAAKKYLESPQLLEKDVEKLRDATASSTKRGKRQGEHIRKLEVLESQIDSVKRTRQKIDSLQEAYVQRKAAKDGALQRAAQEETDARAKMPMGLTGGTGVQRLGYPGADEVQLATYGERRRERLDDVMRNAAGGVYGGDASVGVHDANNVAMLRMQKQILEEAKKRSDAMRNQMRRGFAGAETAGPSTSGTRSASSQQQTETVHVDGEEWLMPDDDDNNSDGVGDHVLAAQRPPMKGAQNRHQQYHQRRDFRGHGPPHHTSGNYAAAPWMPPPPMPYRSPPPPPPPTRPQQHHVQPQSVYGGKSTVASREETDKKVLGFLPRNISAKKDVQFGPQRPSSSTVVQSSSKFDTAPPPPPPPPPSSSPSVHLSLAAAPSDAKVDDFLKSL